ncbi:hypothetical protein [Methylobacterium gnaphalii]|uniref:Uncharacterized protein n=1 Tax=Methylobacterium gnaphalii TaxID=1010610 RepID=A0A512JQK7_9HYPH|nr:hypothetical protein [Methylobacterium gnaphalii]GEP12246.1 hypothetical protein MGN01_40910 [Methylobacterium gnaphalii]GJD68750.1 hypothetical protein MMMDOFMJ_1674 [Methylobacterium gnaphalii]GLS49353.1 hypothetical protein GCM10007885_22010 [Methylobacterium gnaphalii]
MNMITDEIALALARLGIGAGSALSFRNRLRNGAFTVNQRAVSGTVTLAAGVYGHDGFKAGSGGCTYTFAKTNGVTFITITAGTLLQIVPGTHYLPEGGAYTASWLGTAQARINGGAYTASPQTVLNIVPEANTTIEWGTGTLARPQFEPGTAPSLFEVRDDELWRCQRWFSKSYPHGVAPGAVSSAGTAARFALNSYGFYDGLIRFPRSMASTPQITAYNHSTGAAATWHFSSGDKAVAVQSVSTEGWEPTGNNTWPPGDYTYPNWTASCEP